MASHPVSALDRLPATRQAILRALKQRGDATAEELAGELGITVSAVRQQLAELRAAGLVAHEEERHGPGRPRHRYRLAPGGHALFPAAYGELTLELLGGVAAEEPALVDRLFARRRHRRVAQARARLRERPLPEQVAELARILDEDGYVATCEETADGAWRIVEHHCAIFAVAKHYGQACSSELGFLREVLPDATVERVAHLVAGAHHCAYEIRRRPVRP